MAVVNSITPHVQNLKAPAPLRALQGWVIWRYEHAEGEKKARKIPYYATGARRFGIQGSPADRASLATFDAAKKSAAMRGFDGVGLALLPEFGITALDFDNCVGPNGIDTDLESMLAGTYAEYSPSGQGVRAFVTGDLGNRKSHASAEQYGFETFHSKGFVTFTGMPLEITELTGAENTISEPSPGIQALHQRRFAASTSDYAGEAEPILGLTEEQIRRALAALNPNMPHNDWLQVGLGLHHETGGDGFEFWNDWSAAGADYPGREELEYRWNSFGQSTDRPVTARTLIHMANEAGAELNISVAAASDFAVIPEPPRPAGGYFKIRSAADFMQTIKPVSWLIKGLLPKATLGVLYGESGSGKTFVTFDLCAALGRGIDWNGLRGRKARVLYVVAEGVGGFNLRVKAYCHQAGIGANSLGIDIISDVVPNLTDGASVNNLIGDIKEAGTYDLIVMDTFAQVTPGANENSGEDMGRALAFCRKISQSTGAMVLLVHHSGKDTSRGARGWSGVKAAADVMLEVSRFENDRCLSVEKQKDGRDGAAFGFKLHDVVLGQDEDEEDITSCIVEYTPGVTKKSKKLTRKMGPIEKIVMTEMSTLVGLTPDSSVRYGDLKEACISQIPRGEAKQDERGKRVARAIESLIGDAFLLQIDGNLQFTRETDA